MYWGRESRRSEPDIMYAWRGTSGMKCDSRLLHSVMSTRQPDFDSKPIFSKMQPSFIEELEARGYDITTIRFSISKKKEEVNNEK